uniref:transmembrane protein 238-like n=2 Tax=Pristiophorus japonicus TaxID=55135 RepID=UPI00398E9202
MSLMGLTRCTYALWLAVVLDAVGLATLLVGIFADLQRAGRDYGDMLIYTGAIVVFVSLIGWVFWYTGNMEISAAELARDYRPKESRLNRLVRQISRSVSVHAGPAGVASCGSGGGGARAAVRPPLRLKELQKTDGQARGEAATG